MEMLQLVAEEDRYVPIFYINEDKINLHCIKFFLPTSFDSISKMPSFKFLHIIQAVLQLLKLFFRFYFLSLKKKSTFLCSLKYFLLMLMSLEFVEIHCY